MDKDDIYKTLYDNAEDLRKKVSLYDNYSKNHDKIMRKKKIIYCLEYILPFVVSSYISSSILSKSDRNIFLLDEVKYYENIEYTYDSNGNEYVKRSSDTNFFDDLYYTTGWIIDDFGNYAREEIHFDVSLLNQYSPTDLLKLDLGDLQQLFSVVDYKKYIRSSLSEDDYKYEDDMIVIIKSDREYIEEFNRIQTPFENLLDILIAFLINLILGLGISKIFVRHRLTDKINAYLDEIRKINIDECRELLEIREENLELFKDIKEEENHGGFHLKK